MSEAHHETGFRHKGNLERYIRGIYKKGIQKEKDAAQEARDIAAIDAVRLLSKPMIVKCWTDGTIHDDLIHSTQAAAAAMGISIEQASSKPVAGPSKSRPNGKPTGPSYSDAASLGFEDPLAAKLAAEKELRDKEGRAGDWEIVTVASTSAIPLPVEEEAETQSAARERESEPGKRRFTYASLQEKTLPDNGDDDYANIAIKVKKRDDYASAPPDLVTKAIRQAKQLAPLDLTRGAAGKGKMAFKPVEAGDIEEETEEQAQERNQAAWDLIAPKTEDDEDTKAIQPQSDAPVFKKRKAASGNAASTAKRRA
ncbi:hypothetical protein EMMF5_001735 [Cystobasidiomycetes sp. EMM_F5]